MQTPPDVAARLAWAEASAAVADQARTLVADAAADPDDLDFIVRARALLMAVQGVRELAVVVERARGRTWDEVARALGVPVEFAHETYGEVCARWEQGDEREAMAVIAGAASPSADARETAARLDAWWARAREPWDPEHPVSDVLR